MAGAGIRSKSSVTTPDGRRHASNTMLHAAAGARDRVLAAGQSATAAHDAARKAAVAAAPATARQHAVTKPSKAAHGQQPAEPAWKRYQRMADEHREKLAAQASQKPAAAPKAASPAPKPAAPMSKDHTEALGMLKSAKSVTVTNASPERMALYRDLVARGHAEASPPNERGHVTFRMAGQKAAEVKPATAPTVKKSGMVMPRITAKEGAGMKSSLGKLSKEDLGLVASVTNAMARGDWGYASKMKPHELERAEKLMSAMGMI
jgi:hypothetical protein